MFKCTNCSHISEAPFKICPICNQSVKYTEAQIRDYLYIIHKARKARKYEIAVSGYRALAEIGHTPSEIEYAKILEQGELVPRDIETAMQYYYSAASKNDAYAAYRYSLLLSKRSEGGARFWLLYSALLGEASAYPDVAEYYSSTGDEVSANYYYMKAADAGNKDCAVALARRYYGGIGADPSDAHAKWYLESFKLTPLKLMRLAYKLRSVKSERPAPQSTPRVEGLAAALAKKAKELHYFTAYFNIVSMLSRESSEYLSILGVLYAEGIGCDRDTQKALDTLRRAASVGEISAYRYIANMYIEGNLLSRNTDEAIDAYTAAAKLGDKEAYELIGDLYHGGSHVRCDLARAIEYYDKAARMGNSSAYNKAEALKDEREDFFKKAEQVIDETPELSFKNYAISAGMGYTPAYERLARCYKLGIGTKKDRRRAFMWYEYAVRQGEDSALFDFGCCFSRGIGTAFDFDKAIKTLTLAKNKGDARAEGELIRLMENKKRALAKSLYSLSMRLIYKKKFATAKKMLDVCAELELPKAVYTLGCAYEFGIGTNTDRDFAFKLYERAYAMKFRDPRQEFKLKILKMVK